MSAATFYGEMADMATELFTEFGAQFTITRTTGESTDPVTFVVTPGSDTTYTPYGIIKPYPLDKIDGTLIKAEDRMLILDDTIEPLLTDVVTTDSESWNIVSITTIKPDDATSVVHFVQVRK